MKSVLQIPRLADCVLYIHACMNCGEKWFKYERIGKEFIGSKSKKIPIELGKN